MLLQVQGETVEGTIHGNLPEMTGIGKIVHH